jgi:hypothetical protein
MEWFVDFIRSHALCADNPHFLSDVASALPHDLHGCLCLVGAGPWAEIYCAWIKQRGGVAVDIGSGFDLLDGTITRPIHRVLGLGELNPYALPGRASGAAKC